MSIDEFLKSRGHNPKSMISRSKTKNWLRNTEETLDNVENDLERATAIVETMGERNKEKTITEIWQMVQGWRKKQAEVDYRLADNIRLHCKIILKNSLIKTVDEDGEKFVSTLKPNDLLSICKVAETVQRIQRLAVGLSTENVGVDGNIEVSASDAIPIFQVEMKKDGKFVQIR
jgi:hypothetical protein